MVEASRTFLFNGKRLPYNRIKHNNPTERSVEVPIAFDFLANCPKPARILEVGNVLSYYENSLSDALGISGRRIIDKFEIALGVDNQDLMDLPSHDKYDAIVCVSTVEHIGQAPDPTARYGEKKFLNRDLEAPLKAIGKIYDLLTPGGKALITMPFGKLTDGEWYIQPSQEYLDLLVKKYSIPATGISTRYLRLIDRDLSFDRVQMIWVELEGQEVADREYNHPFPFSNGIAIIELTKQPSEFVLNLQIEPTPLNYYPPYEKRKELSSEEIEINQSKNELVESHNQIYQLELELKQSQSQLYQVEVEVEKLQNKLAENELELKQAKIKQNQAQEELEKSEIRVENLSEQLDQNQSILYEVQAELAELYENRQHESDRLDQIRNDLKDCQSTLKQTQEELQKTQEELQKRQDELYDKQEELDISQAQLYDVQEELEQVMLQLEDVKQTEQKTVLELLEYQTRLEELQWELEQSQTDLENYQLELIQVRNDLNLELEQVRNDLNLELEQVRNDLNLELEQVRNDLNLELEQVRNELVKSSLNLEQTLQDFEENKQELTRSQNNLEQKETELYELKLMLSNVQKKWKRSQSQLSQVFRELEYHYQLQLHQGQDIKQPFGDPEQPVSVLHGQAKGPQPDVSYKLFVWDAWYAYQNGDLKKMRDCLEQSLKYTDLSRTETIINWLDSFGHFAVEQGGGFDTNSLTQLPEWRNLVRRLTTINSTAKKI